MRKLYNYNQIEMFDYFIKKITPEKLKKIYRKKASESVRSRIQRLPLLNEMGFARILSEELTITAGDTVFVHSSLDRLNLDFPVFKALSILLDLVGTGGALLFPTYPRKNSYEFVQSGEVFDIRKSPSFTGLLSELARRHKDAKRSLHPVKSVAVIGNESDYLASEHHKSVYPYDKCSPYYRISELNAKVVGLGVSSTYLSSVHAVDDFFKEDFPVMPYHNKVFSVPCILWDGSKRNIDTYIHNMRKMNFNLPKFFAKYLPGEICRDLDIGGMKFFIAHSKPFLERMTELAKKNITIYAKYHYKISSLLS